MAATRVIFLAGLGRSGTTLIERVLGQVPGVCAAGELVHLWQRAVLDNERCGCGRPFDRCPFWTEVGARAFGEWPRPLAEAVLSLRTRVDRSRHLPHLVLPRAAHPRGGELADYLRVYRFLYSAIGTVSGAQVIVDSSKHPSLAFCLRHAPGLDVRVVHVVRDSRGVAYSWTKETPRPESHGGESLMTRYSPMRSALLWNSQNASLAVLGRLGMPRLVLRYEDFVRQPEKSLRRIADFANLDIAVSDLDFLESDHVELAATHTVAGNPMRFQTGRIALCRDDAWREQLPRRQRHIISAMTAPLLSAYGYPIGLPA